MYRRDLIEPFGQGLFFCRCLSYIIAAIAAPQYIDFTPPSSEEEEVEDESKSLSEDI